MVDYSSISDLPKSDQQSTTEEYNLLSSLLGSHSTTPEVKPEFTQIKDGIFSNLSYKIIVMIVLIFVLMSPAVDPVLSKISFLSNPYVRAAVKTVIVIAVWYFWAGK